MARLQRENFDIGAEIRGLADRYPGAGAVVSFLGTVRDFSKGEDIQKLVFESYAGMAEKELDRLERDARGQFDILGCLVIHRFGEVGVGDNIVLIVVASAHRPAGFEACRWMIEELKRRVPIWKNEFTTTGRHWVEEHP